MYIPWTQMTYVTLKISHKTLCGVSSQKKTVSWVLFYSTCFIYTPSEKKIHSISNIRGFQPNLNLPMSLHVCQLMMVMVMVIIIMMMISAQAITFQQPRFPWNSRGPISLPQLRFGGPGRVFGRVFRAFFHPLPVPLWHCSYAAESRIEKKTSHCKTEKKQGMHKKGPFKIL